MKLLQIKIKIIIIEELALTLRHNPEQLSLNLAIMSNYIIALVL